MNKYYPKDFNARFENITHDQERDYFKRARAGDTAARDFLIKNHLLFAAIQGQKWAKNKLPEDEVTSAANFALMTAIDKFDYTRDNRFASYLRKFIRGEIAALWRSKNIVDSPKHPEDGSWSRSLQEMTEKSLANGTLNPCAEVPPPDSIFDEMTEEHPTDEDDHKKFLLEALRQSKDVLLPREAEVIDLHFGENEFTWEEIAQLKGLTRSRICQIKDDALRKLRAAMAEIMGKAGVSR